MIHSRADYNERFGEDPDGKIAPDEPVFMARAQDKHFTKIVQHYRALIVADPEISIDDKIEAAKRLDAHVELATEWQAKEENTVKSPDTPRTEVVCEEKTV